MGRYYGPKEFEHYAQAFWNPSEFLFSEWSEDKQKAFNEMYNFSLLGWSPMRGEFDRILDNVNDNAYLRNNQLSWSSVRDPRKLSQSRDSHFGSINFMSSNIKRLYD